MQLNETYQLCLWITQEISNASVLSKFDALFNILNANMRRPSNQVAQPFENEKLDLLKCLESVNVSTLSLEQIRALETLGIKKNIGLDGKKKVNEILTNLLDIAHVADQINSMKDEILKGVNTSDAIKSSLEPLITEFDNETPSEQVLTRVIFDNEASVNDIKELKDWASKWFDIGRGFAMSNGQTPEDVKVVGAGKGSLIIELSFIAATALSIAKAIKLTLDAMVKYRDYQLKSIEVRNMKADNPKLIEELEEDAKRWEARATQLKKEVAADITEDIKQYFESFNPDNQAELEKAIKTLVDFLSKGGDVDCIINNDVDEEKNGELADTLASIREDFIRIRQLKETLLIEHKTNSDEYKT